jgi:hypothetical protein
MDRAQIKVGDPVVLNVVFENLTKQEWGELIPEVNFTFHIVGAVTRDVPMTRLEKSFKEPPFPYGGINVEPGYLIQPNSAVLYPVRLDELFDLTVPDLYTVSVSFDAPIGDKDGHTGNSMIPVESNELHFLMIGPGLDVGKIIPLPEDAKVPTSLATSQPTAAP